MNPEGDLSASGYVSIIPYYGTPGASSNFTRLVSDTPQADARYYPINGTGKLNGLNSYVEWPVCLASGTHEIEVWYRPQPDGGDLTVMLDGANVFTTNGHSPVSSTVASRRTGTVTVGKSGLHTLRLEIKGKNASSTGYVGLVSGVFIKKQF